MGVFNTPLQPGTYDPSKYRCNFPTEYVWPFEKLSCFRLLQGRLRGVFDTPLRPGTYGTSKNSLVFVPYGAACMAYPIRPYNWIRVTLRNTDANPQSGTCGSSKNSPVFVPFEPALWGVFNTPLRSGTCDSSKYRCDPPTGYVRGFKKWICIRHRRWRMVGRIRYAPTTGYVRSFEIPMQFPNRVRTILRNTDAIPQQGMYSPSKKSPVFVSYGAVCGVYAIRLYNWVRAILRNTDAIS